MVSVCRYGEFLRPTFNMDFPFLAICTAQGSMGKLFNFATFEGCFYHFFMGNILFSLHCSVPTKRLINMKVRFFFL